MPNEAFPAADSQPVTQLLGEAKSISRLNPSYSHDMGQAWEIEASQGIDGANNFRTLKNLPLIELGDGK